MRIKFVAVALTAILMMGVVGCSPSGFNGEEIDETKTQLYVSNYAGGMGSTWLDEVKKRFEADYADYELNGKKGVQIIPDNHRNAGHATVMTANSSIFEVFFNERAFYYDMVAGNLTLDITDVVTETNTDGKTIESKMTAEQRDFFGYKKADGAHYYALPHYGPFNGMYYNRDVFRDYELYMEGDPDNGYRALKDGRYYVYTDGRNKDVLSAGPDDVHGTEDDGLPATYEQFYALLNEMVQVGVTPFTASGQYLGMYAGWYLESLMADYEGFDQMMLQVTFDGTAKNLVKSINNGVVEKQAPVEITPANGYKVYETAGRYHALNFFEHLLADSNYYSEKITSGSHSHTVAQSDFLRSYYEKGSFDKPIAMFIEGGWWMNEVRDYGTIKRLEDRGVSLNDINVAYMPWPKVDESELKGNETRTTLLSSINAVGFIKSSIDTSKIELAKAFLKYCYTDYELEQFSVNSDVMRALNYTISPEAYNKMSNVGKSYYDKYKSDKTDIVYPYSSNPVYIAGAAEIDPWMTFETSSYSSCIRPFRLKEISAQAYFNGITSLHNAASWKKYDSVIR